MRLLQFVSIALSAAFALSTTATAERVDDPIPIPSLPLANNSTNSSNSRRVSSMGNPDATFLTFGSDIIGRDVGSMSGRAWWDCGVECKRRSNCHAFTWTDYNGGTCWFKDAAIDLQGKGGAVSGVNAVHFGSAYLTRVVSRWGDYPGNDFKQVNNPSSCQDACASDGRCYAFASANKVCYLKTAPSTLTNKNGVLASVLFRYQQTLW